MSRRGIYYWKCDRPAAFHGTEERQPPDPALGDQLANALQERFPGSRIEVTVAPSQGNHLTWNVSIDGAPWFARIEHGPEGDDHLAIESAVMARVAEVGVPVPRILAVDASRTRVPFAWQVMERIPHPDLNHWAKRGELDAEAISFAIGAAVATWQSIQPQGFGPFATAESCYHPRYEDYFRLRLPDHLRFLVDHGFLDLNQTQRIEAAIERHRDLLALESACLVHKDLALWNILGEPSRIAAFIDFDDAIGGDPMDDLSLLACFHDGAFLAGALRGYQSVRPLPAEAPRRLWLHLLRNMIVKAVIRTGAGYFSRGDGFFLIGSGSTGADLRLTTHQRIALALEGLEALEQGFDFDRL